MKTKDLKKKRIEKVINKMDAEIMDWVYAIIKINFRTIMVQDSTELREILESNITKALSLQKQEIVEEIEESQHNFPENLNDDEAVGWDMAHENIKATIN